MDNKNIFLLIVDDEPDLLEIVSETFEDEGFNVISKENGQDALDYFLEDNKVDVIISDSHMPKLQGLELLEKIKESGKPIPLFYLCTGDIEITLEELKALSAKGLIEKPYDLVNMIDTVVKDLEEIS